MPGELQIEAGRDYEVIADGVALHGTEQPHSGFTRDTVVVLTKGDVITCMKVAGSPQDRLYWFKRGDVEGRFDGTTGPPLELVLKAAEQ
jgi:hypothetical protein